MSLAGAMAWLRDAAIKEIADNHAVKGDGALSWDEARAQYEIEHHEDKLRHAIREESADRIEEHVADLANSIALAMHAIGQAPRCASCREAVAYLFDKTSEYLRDEIPTIHARANVRRGQSWWRIALDDSRVVRERLTDEAAPIHMLAVLVIVDLARYADDTLRPTIWHEPSGACYGDDY